MARALSKLGYCSRAQAFTLIHAGQVRLNGRLCRDPETPVRIDSDRIEVNGVPVARTTSIYLMLNKPRGLVTTRSDEQGRDTVYTCFSRESLPWLAPVGRLDKASEGLILFTNDTAWADRITSPESHVEKTYHVQIDCVASLALLDLMTQGVRVEEGELLSAKRAALLRSGERHCWLEVVLDEGRNRHLRRLLDACGVQVLRLIRVAIGPLQLGSLAKGQYRHLTDAEVRALQSISSGRGLAGGGKS